MPCGAPAGTRREFGAGPMASQHRCPPQPTPFIRCPALMIGAAGSQVTPGLRRVRARPDQAGAVCPLRLARRASSESRHTATPQSWHRPYPAPFGFTLPVRGSETFLASRSGSFLRPETGLFRALARIIHEGRLVGLVWARWRMAPGGHEVGVCGLWGRLVREHACPACQGGSVVARAASIARLSRWAKPEGSETLMRVAISVTRPATLMRARRMVSNWASRQTEVLGRHHPGASTAPCGL